MGAGMYSTGAMGVWVLGCLGAGVCGCWSVWVCMRCMVEWVRGVYGQIAVRELK